MLPAQAMLRGCATTATYQPRQPADTVLYRTVEAHLRTFLAHTAGDAERSGLPFKADGEETKDTYSISEWWLDPHTAGPGAHSHDANDDIFYVLEGTVTFLIGTERVAASKGAFLRVPPGVTHDFENRSDRRAGILNVYIPGGFEKDMPAIVEWFERHGAGA